MTFKKREAVHKTEAGKRALAVRQGLREDSGKTFLICLTRKSKGNIVPIAGVSTPSE